MEINKNLLAFIKLISVQPKNALAAHNQRVLDKWREK